MQRRQISFFHRFGPLPLGVLLFVLPALTAVLFSGKVAAQNLQGTSPSEWMQEATNHLGRGIWETNTCDKQAVRLWKTFDIPAGKVTNAVLRITVDNGYTLYLDGQELGRGSDWRAVTEYNVTRLLKPGRHVIAVEGFNDLLEGGLIFGLFIELAGRPPVAIESDESWRVVPASARNWKNKLVPGADWHGAKVIGGLRQRPWQNWPIGLATVLPLEPPVLHFWQRGWFQLGLLSVCAGTGLFCLWLLAQLSAQARSQKVLQVERVRIARDIHDDLGAQLTQLLLLGEVARREQPESSTAREQFAQICDRARELAQAMDEVVWAVNARRDTVRDFASYVCKYAQLFLGATSIRCRLDVEPELPAMNFDLPVRRNLFLAVKEALNNAAKHSQAQELFVRIHRQDKKLSVAVEDNGCGFDPQAAGEGRNGMANMEQRMAEIGGTCSVASQPGRGCLVVFIVPLPEGRRRWFRRAADNELTMN